MSDKNLIGSHVISNLHELKALADVFANQLRSGNIVCLQGDLGAGKTTFVQYVGKAIGVPEEITSPTYTMVALYDVGQNPRTILRFIHIDAYRESMDTNYVQEIIDTAESQHAVVCIEWPEKLGVQISAKHWEIGLIAQPQNSSRIITIGRVE